ncbi:MAG: hypothetical protein GX046_06540 [Tissierellia bacterium]|nr:hypothetical protein [Tissierellia bacterium]
MNKRRLRLLIPAVFLLLLLFFGVRGLIKKDSAQSVPQLEEDSQEQEQKSIKLTILSELKMTKDLRDSFDDVFTADNLVMYYEKGELKVFNLDNKPLWSRSFDSNLILGKNVARVLVIEKSRGNVYHFSSDGELLGSALGLGEIEQAQLTQDNRTLVFFRDNRNILILDPYLQRAGEITVESGAIINFAVSTKDELISLLTLEELEGELLSRLYVYSLEGRLIQTRREEMLALNVFHADRDMLIVYQRGLQFFDEYLDKKGEFIPTNKVSFSKKEGSHLYLVTGSANPLQEEGELELLSFSLSNRTLEFSNKITDNYDNIYSRGGMVLASYKNTLDLYDLTGNLLHREVLSYPIKKAKLLDEDRLAVFDGSRFTLFKIEF